MNPSLKAHISGFAVGAFFGAYIYIADRAINLKGPLNIMALVVMCALCLLLGLSVRRVPEGSSYHQPFKWLAAIAGFIGVVVATYAVVGGMPGHPNFLLMLATCDQLPEQPRKIVQQFLGWSAQHYAGAAKH